jgi:hypothetical protein
MNDWQPIETAPKDGTTIILWLGSSWNSVAYAYWFEPFGTWVRDGFEPLPDDEWFGIGALIPTHWMSAPGAPTP